MSKTCLVLITSEKGLLLTVFLKKNSLRLKYANNKIEIMEGELFTPRVFTKIIEIFVIIGKK